jgi:hypothetical protein
MARAQAAGEAAFVSRALPPASEVTSAFREIVIRVADEPSAENHAAFGAALPTATVFVKLVGMKAPTVPGERYLVPAGSNVQMRFARLANGMQMVLASAVWPRRVAPDEVVATMTGLELIQMATKTPAEGVLVAAEDERDSWTAIKRDAFAAIVGGGASGE